MIQISMQVLIIFKLKNEFKILIVKSQFNVVTAWIIMPSPLKDAQI
jgi:hypothetical protein